MAFVPLKRKTSILKLADLYGKWLVGTYKQKVKGEYSYIYYIDEVETGEIKKLYGNKSLDSYMDDSLIGEMIAISCIQLKDTGKGHQFAVAGVGIWDPNAPEGLPDATILDPSKPTID